MSNRYYNSAAGGGWGSTSRWSSNPTGFPTGASIPTINDDVFFNAVSKSCTLDTDAVCKSIDTTGYAGGLLLNGFDLSVEGSGNFVAGTIDVATGSVLTLGNASSGTVVITGCTFQVEDGSTVHLKNISSLTSDAASIAVFGELWLIDNSGAINLNFGNGQEISNLELSATSTGLVTLDETLNVAYTFTLHAGNNVEFNSTDVFTFGSIDWYGAPGNKIILRSDVDETPWVLVVGDGVGSTYVFHVNVMDSDASGGDAIVDVNGFDAGGTTNWTFGSSSSSSSSCSCSSSFSSSSSSNSCSCSCSSSSSSSSSADTNNKYFVGDVDANWNNGGNWASLSGGPGGAGVPTNVNDVYFDGSSPNCSINTSVNVLSFNMAGYQAAITVSAVTMDIGGDLALDGGVGGSAFDATLAVEIVVQGNITSNNTVVATFGNGAVSMSGNLQITGGTVTQGSGFWGLYGNVNIAAGTWVYNASSRLTMYPAAGLNKTLACNAVDIGNLYITGGSTTSSVTLTDDLIAQNVVLTKGVFINDALSLAIAHNFYVGQGIASDSEFRFSGDDDTSLTSNGLICILSHFNITGTNPVINSTSDVTVHPSASAGCITHSSESWVFTDTGFGCYIRFRGEEIYDLIFVEGGTYNVINNVVVDGTFTILAGESFGNSVLVEEGATIEADAISWNGAAAKLITLDVALGGDDHWKIICNDAANAITYVDARYSDAFGGQTINATDPSNVNSGYNLNWDFGSGPSSSSSCSSSSSFSSSSFSSSSSCSCSSSFSSSCSCSCSSCSCSSSSCSSSFSSSCSSSSCSCSCSCSSSFSSSSSSSLSSCSSSCSSSYCSSSSSSGSDNGERYYVSDGTLAVWGDPLNWSYSSGGPGGAGVPTDSTQVIFDVNSTRSCALNSASECLSLTMATYTHTLDLNGRILDITGTTTITSGTIDFNGGTLVIRASSTLYPSATVATSGGVNFNLANDITVLVKRTANIGNVTITGATKTIIFDNFMANGGLLCKNLVSNSNILSAIDTYLDATNWNLSNCTLTAGTNVYFRGNVTFDTVVVAPGGNFILAANGVMDFDGATFGTIGTLAGAGRAISFPSGFSSYGVFTLRPNDYISFGSGETFNFSGISWNGSAGNKITLRPMGATQWFLDVDDAAPSVTYVDVSYSNASIGNQIDALDGTSVDSHNNNNWLFPPFSSSSSSSSSCSCSSSFSSSSSYSSSCSCSSSFSSSSSCSSSFSSSSSCSSSFSSCSSSSSCCSSSCSCSSSFSSSSFSSCSESSCSCSSSSISGSSIVGLGSYSSSSSSLGPILYTPEPRDVFNPTGNPRYVFNSGFHIEDHTLDKSVEIMQTEVKRHFVNKLKYPGIVRKTY